SRGRRRNGDPGVVAFIPASPRETRVFLSAWKMTYIGIHRAASLRRMIRRLLPVVFLAVGCGGATASPAENEQDFATSDFAEDAPLPSSGEWLDPPRALAGIGQFDRLHATVHDDDKCSTMVAMAAAIVGGKARFLIFLDALDHLRADFK